MILGSEQMEYITVREAAKKWGCSEDTVRKWCRESKITITIGAVKKSGRWQIPANAECPKKTK